MAISNKANILLRGGKNESGYTYHLGRLGRLQFLAIADVSDGKGVNQRKVQ